MNGPSRADELFRLLPSFYQLRDAEQGYPLRSLLQVIAEQLGLVRDNIDQLYDDFFIETCQPWVVPYLGDLVGLRRSRRLVHASDAQSPASDRALSRLYPRGEVANAVLMNRRKGTLPVLEELARNVADWPARAVEFYRLVTHMAHVGSQCGLCVEPGPAGQEFDAGQLATVRDRELMGRIGTAFNTVLHFPDVRLGHARVNRPRYNVNRVGLFVWRLQPYSVTRTLALPCCTANGSDPDNCVGMEDKCITIFSFNPLGRPIPLYIKPPAAEQTTEQATEPAQEYELPAELRLQALREKSSAGWIASKRYYGPDKSLAVFIPGLPGTGPEGLVPRSHIRPQPLAHLLPPDECACEQSSPSDKQKAACDRKQWIGSLAESLGNDKVAVDPEHGLLAVKSGHCPARVSYHYAFSDDLGGGEYSRQIPTSYDATTLLRRVRYEDVLCAKTGCAKLDVQCWLDWARGKPQAAVSGGCEALWSGRALHLVIEICDSAVYELGGSELKLDVGESLEIRAAAQRRPIIKIAATSCGSLLDVTLAAGSSLTFDGLVIADGGLQLKAEQLDSSPATDHERSPSDQCHSETVPTVGLPRCLIRHSTLVPGLHEHGCCPLPSIVLMTEGLCLTLDHSISGAIRSQAIGEPARVDAARVFVNDSILDAAESPAVSGPTSIDLSVERSTIFGCVEVRQLIMAQDSIFYQPVTVTRRQTGGMRFCYVRPNNVDPEPWWETPPQYYCQPALAYQRKHDQKCAQPSVSTCPCDDPAPPKGNEKDNEKDNAIKVLEPGDKTPVVQLPMSPVFTSECYEQPAYAQLAAACPDEIRRGAEDGSEMGVFHDLYLPEREENLRNRVDDFMPVGMQAVILYVN